MEHLMSAETGQRLIGLMHFIEGDDDRIKAFRAFVESGELQCQDVASCPICEDECLAAPGRNLAQEGRPS